MRQPPPHLGSFLDSVLRNFDLADELHWRLAYAIQEMIARRSTALLTPVAEPAGFRAASGSQPFYGFCIRRAHCTSLQSQHVRSSTLPGGPSSAARGAKPRNRARCS